MLHRTGPGRQQLEVGILVTFNYSLLLVTQLAGIRYLVFVTLLVTGLSSLQRCSEDSPVTTGSVPGIGPTTTALQ